jgi:hypothetical protein
VVGQALASVDFWLRHDDGRYPLWWTLALLPLMLAVMGGSLRTRRLVPPVPAHCGMDIRRLLVAQAWSPLAL